LRFAFLVQPEVVMYQSIISQTKPKMTEVMQKLDEEFIKLRTGRASTALVESIKVSYYGTQTPLKQMASLTIPDAASILIQPWDKNALGDVELAIRNSALGLNPVNDGNAVRINLPPMTEERRQELVKHIKSLAEEAKVVLRNVRGDAWNEIKKLEKSGELTEDDRYRAEEELNKIIGDFNKQVDDATDSKEKEVMKI
jgi:ribosome recycling factor